MELLAAALEGMGHSVVERVYGSPDDEQPGNAVRVVANGKFEIVSVRLDRPLLGSLVGNATDLDQQVIEDLIASAVNAALAKAKEMVREEATRLTGGINIPGLDKLIG